jgi:hypothetical protein
MVTFHSNNVSNNGEFEYSRYMLAPKKDLEVTDLDQSSGWSIKSADGKIYVCKTNYEFVRYVHDYENRD